jgi:hypothetical protein
MNAKDLKAKAEDFLWDVTHDMKKLAIAAGVILLVGVAIGFIA